MVSGGVPAGERNMATDTLFALKEFVAAGATGTAIARGDTVILHCR
jgi:hypothetical protein